MTTWRLMLLFVSGGFALMLSGCGMSASPPRSDAAPQGADSPQTIPQLSSEDIAPLNPSAADNAVPDEPFHTDFVPEDAVTPSYEAPSLAETFSTDVENFHLTPNVDAAAPIFAAIP